MAKRSKKTTLLKFLLTFIITPLALVALAFSFSVSQELSGSQAKFRNSSAPNTLAGRYDCADNCTPTSLLAKSFDSGKGFNIFLKEDGTEYSDYEFSYQTAASVRNEKQQVVSIEYSKPFFMKIQKSEIVELDDNALLVKTYLRLPFRLYLTVGYNTLRAE